MLKKKLGDKDKTGSGRRQRPRVAIRNGDDGDSMARNTESLTGKKAGVIFNRT